MDTHILFINYTDLVYGGRILHDDKTPNEYKIISGTTVFVLKKFITGTAQKCVWSMLSWSLCVEDKIECVETETARCPEFAELIRHERMQDLVR